MLPKPKKYWTPEYWASWKPFGVGEQYPNNYWEVFRAMWVNRDNLPHAWDILVVINTYREPGMERYWVPSIVESALFGTKFAEDFFLVNMGGDIAFLNGTLKHLITENWIDESFINRYPTNFQELKAELDNQSWEELERVSGASREEMHAFAKMIGDANKDALNGAVREAVLMSRVDVERLGLKDGDGVVLKNELGEFAGRICTAPIKPGNLQIHWPEGNVLLEKERRSPEVGIPDYNAVVRLEKS